MKTRSMRTKSDTRRPAGVLPLSHAMVLLLLNVSIGLETPVLSLMLLARGATFATLPLVMGVTLVVTAVCEVPERCRRRYARSPQALLLGDGAAGRGASRAVAAAGYRRLWRSRARFAGLALAAAHGNARGNRARSCGWPITVMRGSAAPRWIS